MVIRSTSYDLAEYDLYSDYADQVISKKEFEEKLKALKEKYENLEMSNKK